MEEERAENENYCGTPSGIRKPECQSGCLGVMCVQVKIAAVVRSRVAMFQANVGRPDFETPRSVSR